MAQHQDQLSMFKAEPSPARRPLATLPPVSAETLSRITDPLDLNPQQLQAVTARIGPSLVLAGAGTGKTKVLTRRAAWLIAQGLHPNKILLITFTRKAAAEMLRRVQEINPFPSLKIQGGTFHSMANQWLRCHGSAIGLTPRFTLMDENDASSMLHLLASKQHLHTVKAFPDKRTLLALFSQASNSLTPVIDTIAQDFPQYSAHTTAIAALHRLFVDTKWTQQRFDYDDLLLLMHQLFTQHPEAAARLTSQYHALLVDEYQDTTRLQAELVRGLAAPHQNVMVVGDELQSIYSFRSTDVRNMQDFLHLFERPTVYKLEQNYRSTKAIIQVANRLIEQTHLIHHKTLFTTNSAGPRPQLVECPDEHVQSAYVIDRIRALQQQGLSLHRIAVLVRLSAHSYDLETALTHHRLPFVKYGGLALVETAHVKDFIAYLTVITRPHDRLAWQRLLLLVDRIGPAAAEHLIGLMRQRSQPLTVLEAHTGVGADDLSKLAVLLRNMTCDDVPLRLRLQQVLEHYQPYLKRHYPDDVTERMNELAYLVQCHKDATSLTQLIEGLTETGASDHTQTPDHPADTLILSTIHSAKGLEWDAVFVINVMDGAIPHSRACANPATLEEERRLLYVAVTRARHVLCLTYPVHTLAGHSHYQGKCSRFLESLTADDVDRIVLQ
jgi:DNA helicase-2/ATP-dependent DNA helicase PcrA